jgi:type VI secretion system protein ImpF
MAIHNKQLIEASLLDKLIDLEPNVSNAQEKRTGITVRALRRAMKRDLENLLNAKVRWMNWPRYYRELDQSLFNYGLPDFSGVPVGSLDGKLALCAKVKQTILRFEPRIIDVNVEPVDTGDDIDRSLKLRIEALMHADPHPELISLESEVEPVYLGISVSENLY